MANKFRGEVEFTLDGETYAVRPSFKIVSEIEGAIGGILPFMNRIQRGDYRLTEIVTLVQIVLRGQPDAPKFRDIPDLVMGADEGPIAFLGPIAELLTNAITGGEKPKADDEGNGPAA